MKKIKKTWRHNYLTCKKSFYTKKKKETDNNSNKYIRNLFALKTENKVIKDRVVWDIRNPFEH